MAKGDWEVYEDSDRDRAETTTTQDQTACQMYGHTYETVTDENDEPVVIGTDYIRKCNDCGDTYNYDPEDEV